MNNRDQLLRTFWAHYPAQDVKAYRKQYRKSGTFPVNIRSDWAEFLYIQERQGTASPGVCSGAKLVI